MEGFQNKTEGTFITWTQKVGVIKVPSKVKKSQYLISTCTNNPTSAIQIASFFVEFASIIFINGIMFYFPTLKLDDKIIFSILLSTSKKGMLRNLQLVFDALLLDFEVCLGIQHLISPFVKSALPSVRQKTIICEIK